MNISIQTPKFEIVKPNGEPYTDEEWETVRGSVQQEIANSIASALGTDTVEVTITADRISEQTETYLGRS